VIQRVQSSLQIYITPDAQWSDEVSSEIMRLFRRDFGEEMNIEIVLDDNLIQKSSDYKKFKVVESMVAQKLLSS
jgi:hypothetical protein